MCVSCVNDRCVSVGCVCEPEWSEPGIAVDGSSPAAAAAATMVQVGRVCVCVCVFVFAELVFRNEAKFQ